MITLHLTDQEAKDLIQLLRDRVAVVKLQTRREFLAELADRIQEQQELQDGYWVEFSSEGQFPSRQIAADILPEVQFKYPRRTFKIARSVACPGKWTFWAKGVYRL